MPRPNPLSSLSFAPGGGGSQPPMNINSSFGSDGALSTTLPLRGVDIGPAPDFWGDLQKIMALKAPAATAGPRARTTRAAPPSPPRERSQPQTQTPQRQAMGSGYYTFPINSTGAVLNAVKPGAPRPAGSHIFSTGART
jgi:hypothetical protein